MNADLSLQLNPFSVDGRQLQSDPCKSDRGIYTRYNQSEKMAVCAPYLSALPPHSFFKPGIILTEQQKWQVYIDPYTKMTRLDLYQFDGTPMNPLFLAYSPPQMLPTITMNPTAAAAAPTAGAKAKRGEKTQYDIPLNINAQHIKRDGRGLGKHALERVDVNMVWWVGVGMCVFGGAAYLL